MPTHRTILLLASFALFALQNPPPDASSGSVSLVKLAPLSYPPLGRMTRITGDVKLLLNVRPDGTIDSVSVLSGHPLLQQAALDNARKSDFECRGCETVTAYQLTYSFQLEDVGDCCTGVATEDAPKDQPVLPLPRLTQVANQITVVDRPICICDPAITIERRRSWKCLYLWHCAYH